MQEVEDPETSVIQLPNKAIKPEHDRTWTGGIVYTPKWIPQKYGQLTLTVDFWDIERTGIAMYFSPPVIINGYNAGIFPGVVSPAQPTATKPAVLFDSEGITPELQVPTQTVGVRAQTGLTSVLNTRSRRQLVYFHS